MSDERDTTGNGRDMDAETVAARKGVPIEVAKEAVETTGGGGKVAEQAADANKSQGLPGGKR